MKSVYVGLLIGGIAHNLARYHAGQVEVDITEYTNDVYDVLLGAGLPYKLVRKWVRMAEVKAVKEMHIILSNEDLQSNGGSMVSAHALLEPYLVYLGYQTV